jgi:hypothetical protein
MVVLPLLLGGDAIAGTTTIGDWMVTIENGYQEAYTANASGSQTGVFCLTQTQSCFAYIQTKSECEQGGTTPMLINSPIGAAVSSTTCIKVPMQNSKTLRFAKVEDFDTYRRTVQGGGEFAFAMPLVDGQFAVSRFSGRGATEAVAAAMTAPATAPAPAAAPRDQVL